MSPEPLGISKWPLKGFSHILCLIQQFPVRNKSTDTGTKVGPAESAAHLRGCFFDRNEGSMYWEVHSAGQVTVFTTLFIQLCYSLSIEWGKKKKKRWRWLPVDDTISSLKTTIWDISCQPACSQHNSSSRLRCSTHRFWLPVHHSYRRMSLAGPRIIISLKKCVSIPCQLASVLSVIAFTLTKPINLQNCHTSLYLYPKLMSDAVNGLLLLSRY